MLLPMMVAKAGTAECSIVVGDREDRALHVFGIDGHYRHTIFGGGRDTSRLPSISALAVSESGRIVVSNLGGRMVSYSLNGDPQGEFTLTSPDTTGFTASRVAVHGDTILEHWFAVSSGTRSDYWGGMPLVRVFDVDGESLGSIGRIEQYPGLKLTEAMNRGRIAVHRDTLWFARSSDAVLMAFPLDHVGDESPARVVRLPLFYEMLPPVERVPAGRPESPYAVVEDHIGAFAVDGAGRFYVAQSLYWPREEERLLRPIQVLSIYSAVGEHLGSFDFGYEVVDVSILGYRMAVVLREVGTRVQLMLVDHPLATGGASDGCE
ncbi:MAG: hypothetical protein RRA92_06295 [Gemmatimonadota bacterium]|nr:hypothetical protein [Gemmatimonadota bacterium]